MANNVKVIIEGQNNSKTAFDQVAASSKQLADQFEMLTHAAEGFLGAELVGKFAELVKGAMEADVAIAKLSEKVGMSTQFLVGLNYAAQLSEVGVDELGTGLKKFDQAITAAGQGNKKANEAFAALGIQVKDANGKLKPTEQLLMEVANAFHGSEDGAAKTAIAVALFGRSGTLLIPVLNQGGAAIDGMSDKLERLGGKPTDDAVKAAEKLHSNFVDLKVIGTGLANQFLEGLKPAIDQVADAMNKASIEGDGWAKKLGRISGDLLEIPVDFRASQLKIAITLNTVAAQSDPDIHAQVEKWKAELAELSQAQAKYWAAYHATVGSIAPVSSHGTPNPLGLWGFDDGATKPKKTLALTNEGDDGAAAAKRLEDAKVKLREASSAEQITIAKALEREQLSLLDLEKEQGILSLGDYYKQRRALQETEARAEISALEAKLTAEEAKRDFFKKGSPERLAAQAEVLATTGQIWAAEYNLQDLIHKGDTDELKRKQQLKDFQLACEAEIRTAKGQTLAVAVEAIQKEYDAKKDKLKSMGGSPEDLAGIDMVAKQKVAQVTATNVAEQIDEIYAKLNLDLEQLNHQVAIYGESSITAEQKANIMREKAANQIAALAVQYRALAAAAGDPKMLVQVDQMAKKLDELRNTSDKLRIAVGQGLSKGFEDFFHVLQKGGSAGKAFDSLAMSIVGDIEQMMTKMAAMQMTGGLMKALFGKDGAGMMGGGHGGSGGGGMGGDGSSGGYGGLLGPPMKSLFSHWGYGNAGGSASDGGEYGGLGAADGSDIDFGSADSGIAGFGDSLTSGFDIPGFAGGGSMVANQPAIVGEKGPELWVPNTAGQVVPNGALANGGAPGGGGLSGVQVTVVNNGTPKNAQATTPQWSDSLKAWHMQLHLDDAANNGPLTGLNNGSNS